MRSPGWTAAAIIYLCACLLLGGASAAGAFANGLLQFGGLVLILVLLWRGGLEPAAPEAAAPLWVAAVFATLSVLMLVPLPPAVWTALPFRDGIAEGYRLLGAELPWLPLSLSPLGTISSLLALLPPVAMYMIVVRLSADDRRRLLWALLAAAAVSIMFGAFQLMGGPHSSLRPYQITNTQAAVGFFANSNHLATLLLCALPLTGVLAASFATRSQQRSRRSAGAVASLAIALFLITGIAISGSAAGYGLLLLSGIATVLIYRRSVIGSVGWRWGAAVGLLVLLLVAAGLRGPLSTESLSEEMREDPASRRVLTETTAEAAADSFPVGTGLGTFVNVYRLYEEPNRVGRGYANHAHNDYAEVALELGLAGILLVLAILAWWARQSLRVWRRDFSGAAMARAGSVAIGVIALHSLVDYPIRTAAIAAVAAIAAALLVRPSLPESAARRADRESDARHLEAD